MGYDTERGATKALVTSLSQAESTVSQGLAAFNAGGYSLGSDPSHNTLNDNFIDRCLKAGTEHGLDIIKYAGNGVAGRQIAHDLGKTPTFILIKDLSTDNNWRVYHVALGAGSSLSLNLTNAKNDWTGWWNNTEPTSTHFTVGSHADNNGSGKEYIAYVFTDSDIFKAFSYVGNGSADGPFVNLGGKPLALPFWKNANVAVAWYDVDAVRNPTNKISQELYPSSPAAETASNTCNFSSNGFKVAHVTTGVNGSGNLHVGLAILESTDKHSNPH